MAAGGNTGNNVGSVQGDQIASHTHSITHYGGAATNPVGVAQGRDSSGALNPTAIATTATGGNETRPKNVYVNYIIKY